MQQHLDVAMRGLNRLLAAILVAMTAACAGPVLAPYDQGLVDGLTDFQGDIGGLLLELAADAPDTPYDDYQTRYNAMEARLDALLTRAVVNSEGLSEAGADLAAKVNAVLAENTGADPATFEGLSLSAAQIHDLRSLLRRTREQHEAQSARSSGFWSIRKANFDRAVASALALERFKQEQ
jgi:hypothetical protein